MVRLTVWLYLPLSWKKDDDKGIYLTMFAILLNEFYQDRVAKYRPYWTFLRTTSGLAHVLRFGHQTRKRIVVFNVPWLMDHNLYCMMLMQEKQTYQQIVYTTRTHCSLISEVTVVGSTSKAKTPCPAPCPLRLQTGLALVRQRERFGSSLCFLRKQSRHSRCKQS